MSLDVAAEAFLSGYRIALVREGDAGALIADLLDLDWLSRPFAFEGGAMGCRLLDDRDGGARTERLASTAEEKWAPLIRLGIGCAIARLGLDPPDDPGTLNGFGFQTGLRSGIAESGQVTFSPYSEVGRGRALWFVTGGRGDACAKAIQRAASADALWRGVGTACAFAGDPHSWAGRLREVAIGFEGEIRSGVRDAVEMWRLLEGVPPSRTLEVERAVG